MADRHAIYRSEMAPLSEPTSSTTRTNSRKRPRRRRVETLAPAGDRSLSYFDRVQEFLANVSHHGQVLPEGVQVKEGSPVIRIETDMLQQQDEDFIFTSPLSSFRLMHIPTMFGLSRGNQTMSSARVSARAALLALTDFNNRNESVVRNLRQLLTDEDGNECDLHMTLDFYDTGRSPRLATKLLSRAVYQRGFPYDPAAIVGASRSAVSIPMAVVNTAQQVPQVSYSSTSSTLNNRDMYGMFGRTVPSTDGDAHVLIEYFRGLNVTHMGILYVSDDYGRAYRLSLERAASEYGIDVSSAPIKLDQANSNENSLLDGIIDAVEALNSTGYRYFVGVIFKQHVEVLIEEASKAGIMGQGYVWIFGDGLSQYTFSKYKYPAGTPMAEALPGLGVIGTGISSHGNYYDRFRDRAMAADNTTEFRSYFTRKTPLHSDLVKFQEDDSFFKHIGQFPPLAYDAVMALGIAGCRAKSDFFSGPDLFDAFQAVEFEGASGIVSIDDKTGSRYHNSTTYFISNTLAQPPDEEGMVSVSTRVAAEYYRKPGENASNWHDAEGVPFRYSDMTMDPPPSLPEHDPVHDAVGVVMWVTSVVAMIIIVSAFGFATWTWLNRTSHVVRASQPLFLILICVGVVSMASAVLTLGVDAPKFSKGFADAACMLNWWFWCLGFALSFTSLFAKMWRVNKILSCTRSFRRMVVEPKDVLLPGAIVVLVNFGVLLYWQLKSPLQFYIEFQESSVDEYGRPNKYVKTCQSEDEDLEFYCLSGLFLINGVAIIAANVQAYRARNIVTEFSESSYIGLAMAVSLEAVLIGAPVFFYDASAQASYLARALCMLATSGSILYLMFVPKVVFWRRHVQRAKERALRRVRQLERDEHQNADNDSDHRAEGFAEVARNGDSTATAAAGRHAVVVSPVASCHEEGDDDVGIQVYVPPEATSRPKEESMRRFSCDRSSGLRIVSSHHSRIVSSHHSRGYSRSRASDREESSFRARFDGFSSDENSQETSAIKTRESDPESNNNNNNNGPPSDSFACESSCGLHLESSRHSRGRRRWGYDRDESPRRAGLSSSGEISHETFGRRSRESDPETTSEPFVDRSSGLLVVSHHSRRDSRIREFDREEEHTFHARLSSVEISQDLFGSSSKPKESSSEPEAKEADPGDAFSRTAVTYGSEYSA